METSDVAISNVFTSTLFLLAGLLVRKALRRTGPVVLHVFYMFTYNSEHILIVLV